MQTDAEVAAPFRPCMASCNNPACCEVRCMHPLPASGTNGNGPGPRVSSLRVAQHLNQENAK